MSRVAVVTGSNKGLGLATVKGIAKEIDGVVYITARNEKLGNEALALLKKELDPPIGDKLKFHQLDVTSKESISKFRDHLKKTHGHLDILVNNAGVILLPHEHKDMTEVEINEQTMRCNYYGVKNVCDALFPLLKSHSRVVNVCSRIGGLREVSNQVVVQKLLSEDLTVKALDKIVEDYTEATKNGKVQENGLAATSYGMSKIVLFTLTKIQSRQMTKGCCKKGIFVNACCPGWVMTEATKIGLEGHGLKEGDNAFGWTIKTVDEGADTIVWLAMLPQNAKGPNGQFVAEREIVDWAKLKTFQENFQAHQQQKE